MDIVNYLNIKQRKIAEAYIECGNKTQAAIMAGYTAKNARQAGYDALTNPYVKQYIYELERERDMAMKDTMEKLKMDNEYILGNIKIALEACVQGRTTKEQLVDAKNINELSKTLVEWSGEGASQKIENNGDIRLGLIDMTNKLIEASKE